MAIIRPQRRENPYSQIDRFVFESDPNITWKAKGIMGYLMTRPDGWVIRHADLVKRAKDGKEAVTSGLKELEKAGYIHYYQERTASGKFGEWIYDVFERPEFNPTWQSGFPFAEIPISGFPLSDNTDYSNNNYTNNHFSDYETENFKETLTTNKKQNVNIGLTKHELMELIDEQYSTYAPSRFSKRQWSFVMNQLVEDLMNGQEYFTKAKYPDKYINGCLRNVAYHYDFARGRIPLEEVQEEGKVPFYDWVNQI
jgi:hypothetical protein